MSRLKDVDIRAALHEHLQIDSNVWFRDEVGFHGAVADILSVTPEDVHIYEIKSDVDTLSRLESKIVETRTRRGNIRRDYQFGQVECYSKAADKVTLVVGTKLLAESLLVIPDWWGVTLAESMGDGVSFKEVRDALPNPELSWRYVYELLWRDEVLDLASKLKAPGVRHLSKAKIGKILEPMCPLPELRKFVRDTIPRRIWLKFKRKTKTRRRY